MKKLALVLGVLAMGLTSCENNEEIQMQNLAKAVAKVKVEQAKVKAIKKKQEQIKFEAEINAIFKELEKM